jgi:twitching motility protein PilT
MAEREVASQASVDELMEHAVTVGASDIHFTSGLPPIFRVNGQLVPVEGKAALTRHDTQAIAQQITEAHQWTRFVESRELDFALSRGGVGRYRANLAWQRGSVAIALRVIPHAIPSLEQLGLPRILKKFAMADHGLVLVTGPTGSGKSTTLASLLDYINGNRSCHIVTIEDPIEYLHRHKKSVISQREMHLDTLSFAEALRHVLRQDPDVILIGEMRDLETVQAALTLAETGHLVLATLHTGDAAQSLTRIIDVFPPYQQAQARTQLSLTLVGVLAQQLLRKRDGTGRVVACEILAATQAVSHLIRTGEVQQVYSAIQTGAADGMSTLNASLVSLVRANVITREDAVQKSPRQKELLEQLNKGVAARP